MSDTDSALIRAAVITLSDKGARGEREDLSGKEIIDFLEGGLVQGARCAVVAYRMIPDEAETLRSLLIELADSGEVNLILTSGGTGLSPRDITPEATLSVMDREVPGFAEAMRLKSLEITPHAMLSRAVAVLRGETLIINLPGSPKGARECLEVIAPALPHAVKKAAGDPEECAR
jgi:molybdenum cofactor synthesis domain-containing protein